MKKSTSFVESPLETMSSADVNIQRTMSLLEFSETRDSSDGLVRPCKKKKYKWLNVSTGDKFTAGGILIYDTDGIWVIGEKDRSGVVYSDMGGKYDFEDGTIYAAIARELREETYGLCELLCREVEELSKIYPPIIVNGHDSKPVYMCIVVPRSALDPQRVILDPFLFSVARENVLKQNPEVPQEYYSPCVLCKLLYSDISSPDIKLSYRLKRILKFSKILEEERIESPPVVRRFNPTGPVTILKRNVTAQATT